ncbi:unnamed protein product [Paramecium pentaurelia]|uniref:Uncharacterized protein n=1 Tax=Paramecium pentaurelia TaxID=43138 RepID=A0A8S1TF11_9CILI|nr:unnamed protein product [Paramecium pentaurelia]
MSFHKLMLERPHYTTKKILQPLFGQPKKDDLIQYPNTHRTITFQKPYNVVEIERKTLHQKNDSNQSQSINLKKQRVQEAYNTLSDFNDKKQIIASLKTLNSADERIQLIDKILERKDEMMIAQLKLKAAKLEPIFNVIRRKLKQQRLVSATPKQSKKGTMIIRQKTSDELVQQSLECSKEIKEEKQIKTLETETIPENKIMEKIQSKFTAGVAFSWLANRHENKQIQNENEVSERQFLRRSTALQFGKNTLSRLKQQVSKKVSENSDQLIRQGFLKLEPKREKNCYKNIQSKIDSGIIKPQINPIQKVNTIKRQNTLGFVTSERNEISTFRQAQANNQQTLQ